MTTLHLAPTNSASGSLREALRYAERDDEVLAFLDDLSCGPIDSLDASARAAWWGAFGYETSEFEAWIRRFWDRVASHDGRFVIWFSRNSATELAFFLAWTEQLGERPYCVLDVTERRVPSKKRGGALVLLPSHHVSIMQPYMLGSLLGEELSVSAKERESSREDWQRLRSENAPFRIVTENGLISTSIDFFDPLLLAQVTPEGRTVARILHETGFTGELYRQVGDLMLWARIVALVNEGRLVADGDPWELSTHIRLPEPPSRPGQVSGAPGGLPMGLDG